MDTLPSGQQAVQEAHKRMEAFLAAELGRSLVPPNGALLEQQRQRFLQRFGPDRLRAMSVDELLNALPPDKVKDSMDYWLEFKKTDEFQTDLFGGIRGGSAAKFGVWRDKNGDWRLSETGGPTIVIVDEVRAREVVQQRRDQAVAAAAAVARYTELPLSEIDGAEFHNAIMVAAPVWGDSIWMHKYLHLVCPERVTWSASRDHTQAELYTVGVVPSQNGTYGRDLQIIAFWDQFERVRQLPAPLRYRLPRDSSPRRHWALSVQDDELLQEMISQECLMFGPDTICDLTDVKEIKGDTRLGNARDAIRVRFQDRGIDLHTKDLTPLVYLLCQVCDGNLVALVQEQSKIVAVGFVLGGYRFQPGKYPHHVRVAWLHSQAFRTSGEIGPGLSKLSASSATVAEIEASVLAYGERGWCDFRKTVRKSPPLEQRKLSMPSEAPRLATPPSLTGFEREVEEMLVRKGQVILYGPPGTGKTYHAEKVAWELIARANFGCTAAQLTPEQKSQIRGEKGGGGYLSTCTFHPMYSYEDFVEGYRPVGEGGFRLANGIFRRMAEAASKMPQQRFVLIIDEINRGNIPKIFGELITLLELSKRDSLHCTLPLSQEPFTVPRNLWIIGTMNTADRSISLLDTALRRRFAFKELMPQPQQLRNVEGLSLETWLRALNRRIVKALGRDSRNLQVGHAYLLSVTSLDELAKVLRHDLWPLLQEYCYEDPTKLVAILGKLFDQERADLNWKVFQSPDDLRSALDAMTDQEDTIADPEEESLDEEPRSTEDDEEDLL